jgi:hypothetical protein
MKTEHADQLKDKARAAFQRTDYIPNAELLDAEIIDFDEPFGRYNGKYVVLRQDGEVVAVYKRTVSSGPARGDGNGNFVIDSLSVGVKRIKRAPKGLLS